MSVIQRSEMTARLLLYALLSFGEVLVSATGLVCDQFASAADERRGDEFLKPFRGCGQ